MIEEFRSALRDRGLEVVCEDLGDCYFCYTKDDPVTLITIEKGKTLFSKIVLFGDVLPQPTCELVYANPKGLFAFSDNLEELAEKVLEKVKKVRRTPSD